MDLMAIFPRFDISTSDTDKAHWDRLSRLLEEVERRPPAPPIGRDLVMGLAINYTVREIAPFIRSLRASGYDGEVVLWVSDLDAETKQLLARHHVQLQYAWESGFLAMDSLMARFFSYYAFLRAMENRDERADRVFLTDVRDVVFQGDPFRTAPPGEVVVYLEDGSMTLDTCGWSSRWLREGFGEQALEELRGRRIVCAGTVLGDWNGILRYLLLMQMTAFECSAKGRMRWGIDQGVHNIIVHHNRLSGLRMAENLEHVFTMGYFPSDRVRITADKKITDHSGRVCPIVHQYDRHPAVTDLVTELYGLV